MSTILPVAAQPAFASAADVSSFISGQSNRLNGIDTNYSHCDIFVSKQRKLQLSDEFIRFNSVASFPVAEKPRSIANDEISQRWLPAAFLIAGMYCCGQLKKLLKILFNRLWQSLIFSWPRLK